MLSLLFRWKRKGFTFYQPTRLITTVQFLHTTLPPSLTHLFLFSRPPAKYEVFEISSQLPPSLTHLYAPNHQLNCWQVPLSLQFIQVSEVKTHDLSRNKNITHILCERLSTRKFPPALTHLQASSDAERMDSFPSSILHLEYHNYRHFNNPPTLPPFLLSWHYFDRKVTLSKVPSSLKNLYLHQMYQFTNEIISPEVLPDLEALTLTNHNIDLSKLPLSLKFLKFNTTQQITVFPPFTCLSHLVLPDYVDNWLALPPTLLSLSMPMSFSIDLPANLRCLVLKKSHLRCFPIPSFPPSLKYLTIETSVPYIPPLPPTLTHFTMLGNYSGSLSLPDSLLFFKIVANSLKFESFPPNLVRLDFDVPIPLPSLPPSLLYLTLGGIL